jgi:2-methylcitrate dehydratase PrpD
MPDAGERELAALAAFCVAPDDEILAAPDATVWASARLLDGLAVAAHGSRTQLGDLAAGVFPPSGETGLYSWPDLSAPRRADDAAYVLGVYAFSENYCDTGLGSVAHVNSIVVPALLLAVQQRRVTGRSALAALVVGYNVMEWVGASLNGGRPRMAHQLRGFRPTPTAGPPAAVAVLGRLAGLSADELANAIGLACSQGGGLRPMVPAPTAAIMVQSGEALRRAVHSLALATAGIRANPGILRCAGGFFPAYTFGEPGPYDVPTPETAIGPLSSVSMKLECTPHTFVTMVDAARAIAARRECVPADIESVTVLVPRQHNVISGGVKPFPAQFTEAAQHVPYGIAVSMVTGSHLFPDVIEAGLSDERVRALVPKVTLQPDDDLTTLFDDDPSSWPATVRVGWTDGTSDECAMTAPETSGWTADEAIGQAAGKAVALLGESVGPADELVAWADDAVSWPDSWQRICVHPLTKSAREANGVH